MVKEFLESLEDPERPLLGPNYWIMRKVGILLPKSKIGKIVYICIQELVTFFVLTQYIELIMIKSNLDMILTNLKVSMLSIVCVVKTNTFVLWQDSWIQVIDYVTEADKYERDHRSSDTDKILDGYTKYCRKITYSYWVLVSMTCVLVTTTPLTKYLSSADFREELRNGTELFPHIFSSWMPIDKYHSPGCWVTVLWHMATCVYGTGIMCAYDASIIVIMVFFGGKLELLRERCKQMLGSSGQGISAEEAERNLHQLHRIYVTLTKYSRLFNSLLSPVMFLYVVMCSLMLCASAFQFTSAQNAAQRLVMAEYFIFAIAQLFMFCWHSNDVLIKSQDLIYGPYESQWWTANVHQRKNVLILAGHFRLQYIFKAGPFTDLKLPTFLTIMKGAYSYYTLLRK